MNNKIEKVALVDDHAMINDALAKVIDKFEGLTVILKARNGRELIDQLRPDNLPDLVILDVQMPIMDGYKTASWLTANFPDIFILAVSMIDTELSTMRLIQSGVTGFLSKKKGTDELELAIRSIRENGHFFDDSRLIRLLRTVSAGVLLANNIALAENEIQFMKLASTHLTYKEIAAKMDLSPRTVENYRDSLFAKLDAKNRVGLVRYAIKNGLVSGEYD